MSLNRTTTTETTTLFKVSYEGNRTRTAQTRLHIIFLLLTVTHKAHLSTQLIDQITAFELKVPRLSSNQLTMLDFILEVLEAGLAWKADCLLLDPSSSFSDREEGPLLPMESPRLSFDMPTSSSTFIGLFE